MTESRQEYIWENFWKELITNEDGTVDIEKLKKELYDYKWLLDQVAFVYTNLTGGSIQTANHSGLEVIYAAADFIQTIFEYRLADLQKKYDMLRDENIRLLEHSLLTD